MNVFYFYCEFKSSSTIFPQGQTPADYRETVSSLQAVLYGGKHFNAYLDID